MEILIDSNHLGCSGYPFDLDYGYTFFRVSKITFVHLCLAVVGIAIGYFTNWI